MPRVPGVYKKAENMKWEKEWGQNLKMSVYYSLLKKNLGVCSYAGDFISTAQKELTNWLFSFLPAFQKRWPCPCNREGRPCMRYTRYSNPHSRLQGILYLHNSMVWEPQSMSNLLIPPTPLKCAPSCLGYLIQQAAQANIILGAILRNLR